MSGFPTPFRALALLAFLGAALSASAEDPASPPAVATPRKGPLPKRVYQTVRLTGAPPKIDGKLDDPCWRDQGAWAGDYTQREPREGLPASQPTNIKILYDDANIYVAFRCFDSELARVQHLRGKRDEFTGEMVGVNFDSYFDHRTGFEFDVTSGGSQIDLILRNDGWDSSWNAVWESHVGREADAWTAEFRIPLSQLRYANKPEQIWGLHSWRWIKRLEEESDWQLLPMDSPGFVYSFGELHGISGLKPSRRIELLPYVSGRYATSRAESGNPYRSGSDTALEAGLDAKIGLTSDFTADLTLNPDFGQVEADPSEINLTTFETFFDERRPFFLEGKNIFDFRVEDDRVFYSRRIGHHPTGDPATSGYKDVPTATRILGAAKITGKTPAGLSVGVLYALTDRERARVMENGVERRPTVEPMTHYLVTRVQQDFDKSRTVIGGIFTATMRDLGDDAPATLTKNAFTGGLDLLHHWSERTYFLDAKVTASRVEGAPAAIEALMKNPVHNYQRPDATHLGVEDDARSLSGESARIAIGKDNGGKWRYHARLEARSPGLELNDLGYLRVADQLLQSTGIDYVDTAPLSFHRNYDVHFRQVSLFDWAGTHLEDSASLYAYLKFMNNWSVFGRFDHDGEFLDTRVLRGGPALLVPGAETLRFELNSPSTKPHQFGLGLEHSFFADGAGSRDEIEPSVSLRVRDSILVHTEVSYEHVLDDFQYAGSTDVPGATRYLMGRMDQHTLGATLRVDANFHPQLSLTWYGSVFFSGGEFSQLKRIAQPRASSYRDRFQAVSATAIDDGTLAIADGGETYAFANPDFNWREFKSNLVLRWEYRPGSTLYAVWSQNRTSEERARGFSAAHENRTLFGAHPDNTFLIKASYWFSL